MKVKLFVVLTLAIIVSFPSLSMAVESVHFFDCGECHLPNGTLNELSTDNVCVRCHTGSGWNTTLNAGSRYNSVGTHNVTPQARFDAGDASNVHGNNPLAPAQTSHHWAISTTYNAAAGSSEPNRALYPNMYSQYNVSTGKVTCTRCHDPHGDYQTNPKLLRLSPDNLNPMTENELCEACHSDFAQTQGAVPGYNALMTHPIMDSTEFTTLTSDNPAYDVAGIQNYNSAAPYTNSVVLIEGGVSCSTCHAPHFADSRASTPDGPGSSSTGADGTLLRSDGPGSLGGDRNSTAQLRSNLCQSCHTYKMHGDPASTHNIGCLDCHGGHSYNGGAPSLYVLADVSPDAVPTRASKAYDTDKIVDYPQFVTVSTRTEWADNVVGTATGFCEVCHGDVNDPAVGGLANAVDQHKTSGGDECSNCHTHNDASYSFKLDASAASCGDCHGFPPYKDIRGDRAAWYDARDGGYAYYNAQTYGYNAATYYKDETKTAHKTHAGRDLKSDANTAILGADGWYFVGSAGIDNCTPCHGPDSGKTAGGHKIDPGTDSDTFRNIDFVTSAIANGFGNVVGTQYNADAGDDCSNVYCHSSGAPRTGPTGVAGDRNWNAGLGTTPVWVGNGGPTGDGFDSITNLANTNRCQTCHGNDIGSMTSKNNTAAHAVHINSATLNYACGVCHENTAIDKDTLSANATDQRPASGGLHVNGVQNVVFNSTILYNALAGESYDSTGDGTCSVYCHDAPSPGNPNGTGRFADWDTDTNLGCNSCHDDQTTSFSGSHERHSSDANGPRLNCAECHDTNADLGTHTGHLDGAVTYNTLSGADELTWGSDYPQNICDRCHGWDTEDQAAGALQPTWGSPASGKDCATCHAGSVCGAIFNNPSGSHNPDHLANARTSGHNRPTSAGVYNAATGNPAANADCTTCHLSDSPYHWDGKNYNTNSVLEVDLLLRTDNNFTSPYDTNEDLYCLNCHGTSPAGTRNHPTHAAAQVNNQDIVTHKGKKCVACHNVHGDQNLQMIWRTSEDQNLHDPSTGSFAGSLVYFTNLSDFTTDSFDEDDGTNGVDGTGNLEDNADDLCAVCHSSSRGVAHNNIENTGGSHGGSADQLNTNCLSSCHTVHNDATEAFLVAAGTACDQCHDYPPATAAHLVHTENTRTAVDTDDQTDCENCHTGAGSYTYSTVDDQLNTLNHSNAAGRRSILNNTVGFAKGAGNKWTCATACHNTDTSDGFWYTWDDVANSTDAIGLRVPIDSDGLNCDKCHYYSGTPTGSANDNHGSAIDGRAEPISASHNEHFEKNKGCGECHNIAGVEYNSGGSIAGPLAHINDKTGGNRGAVYNGAALASQNEAGFDEGAGVRDVVRTDMTYNDANTCSGGITTGCHASGSPVWDVAIPATGAGCMQCHTDTTTAAYNPTSGLHNNSATLTVTNNAHDGNFDGGNEPAGDCVTCHTTTPSVNHINGSIDASGDITVNVPGGTYTPGSPGNCTTSCHSVGATWTYKWSTTVYNSTGAECANCHGDFSGWNAGVTPHTDLATRGDAHSTVGTLIYPCTDCHAIGSASNYTYNSVNADWNAAAGETSNHGDGVITMNQPAGSTFSLETSYNPDRVGCINSNAGCHNQTDLLADTNHTFPITTTGFSTATVVGDVPVVECYSCHGGYVGTDKNGYWPNAANGTGGEKDRGKHEIHMAALANSNSVYSGETLADLLTNNGNGNSHDKQIALCTYCHDTPGGVNHKSGLPADVNNMYFLSDKTADDGVYSSLEAAGNDTCSTVDCHFNKTTQDDVYGWYDTPASSACIMCHLDVPTDPAHTAHTGAQGSFGRNIGCADCHDSQTEWDVNAPSTGHIDNTYEVAGGSVMDGTLNTYTSNSCGTNDCHNAGNGDLGTTPAIEPYAWGTDYPDSCIMCHAATPTVTGAHDAHINNTTYVPGSCNECHTAANVGTHIDAKADFSGAITVPASNNGWDQSCTNNCHASSSPSGTLWNSGTVVDCTECHSSTYVGGNNWRASGNNYLAQTGLHDEVPVVSGVTHDDNFLYNGGGSTGDCETCHSAVPTSPATAHADGNWGMTYNSATNAVINFAADVNYADAAKPTCSPNGTLSSCHFDGGDWSRIWFENSDTTAGNLQCAGCHGYWATGSDGSGWRTGSSHAENPTRGSTSTHNPGQINLGFDCYACHVLGGTTGSQYPWASGSNDWAAIELGTTLHGDGNITMNQSGITPADNEHNVSGRSGCSTCHPVPPDSHDFPASTFPLAVVDGIEDPATGGGGCNGCHGGNDGFWPDASTANAENDEPGMHTAHMDVLMNAAGLGLAETEACNFCHPYNAGQTSYEVGNHNDGTLKLPDNATTFYNSIGRSLVGLAVDSDGVFNGNSTCSNINCHFDNGYTPHWYAIDNIAPDAASSALTLLAGPNPNSLQVTFNAPGMDAGLANTTAYVYDMRISESPINAGNFDAATYVGGLPATYVYGEPTEVNIENLDPLRTYYVALRTQDTEGLWSATPATAGPVAPNDDTEAPMFHGANKATQGDEGASINLWWTAAEDHSMYIMDANPTNRLQQPITYNIYLKSEKDGDLDMADGTGLNAPVITGFTGTEIELEGTYGATTVTNDITYQLGARACDMHGTCDTNTAIVKVTPKKVPEVPQEFFTYVSNAASVSGGGGEVVTMFNSGTPGAAQTGTFSTAAPLYFITEVENFPRIYYTGSFTIYIDPGNGPPEVFGELGTWNGTTFNGSTKIVSFTPGSRSARTYTFKFSDASGVSVASGESLAIKLTAASAVTCGWGSAANRGDADVGERKVNIAPDNITPVVSLDGAIVNMSWTHDGVDTDGIPATDANPDATTDPVHFDIYGSNNGPTGPWDYVIAENYVATGPNYSYSWDTQADGITSGDIAVKIRPGDGFGHNVYTSGILGTATAIDKVAPSQITDLSVLARPKSGSVLLRWTCPGDDYMNNGRATKFEIRYSPTGAPGISDGATFNSATLVPNPPYPDFGYHVMDFEVTGLTPEISYDFAIKAVDEQDLKSPLSNIATNTTGPRCGMCHTTGPSVVESAGNHKLHGRTLDDCNKCHDDGTTPVTSYNLWHQDGRLKMGYGPSGAVEGVVAGSTITYTEPVGSFEMYKDTNGFGGFGNGDYANVAPDSTDNGTCSNFGAMGVGGCHGPVGTDPDGGGANKFPLFDTPTWDAAANLDCGRCHGNPNRDETAGVNQQFDAYGRDFDGTLYNSPTKPAGVVPDQILGAPSADNRGNWQDDGTGTVDERKYIGQHEKHLNYSFRFSKGDSCNLCHKGHYSDIDDLDGKHGDGNVDVLLDTTAAGADAHYNSAGAGTAGTCFNMDPFNCHPNNETPAWDTNAEFPCIGCHTMGNDIANIGHFTDPDGLVTLDKDDTANMDGFTQGLTGNCTWCHFAGHPTDDVGGAAIILPNNPQVGINYKSGGIHLRRDPGNLGRTGAPYATQAELCWGCHDANNISEWGADDGTQNAATNPIVNPGVNYNYGSLSNGTAPFQTSDWTTAQWTSGTPAFGYKSGKIQSTHSTNLASGHSDLTWNAGASQWEETTDAVANIQCHNCHDVHNMNFADGDTMNGNPYLRGTWVRNPYPEDGAPLSTSSYTAENEYMAVPRGGTMYNNTGGYQIDQNNYASGLPPTKGLSVGNSAGICMLCHGANGVDGMDMTADNGVTGLWLGGQGKNGHSNAALGGTADDLLTTNILSYAIRNPTVTPPSPLSGFSDGADPNMGYSNAADGGATTTRVSGFRSAYGGKGYGVLPQVDGSYYAYVDFDWGVTQATSGIDKGYHAFTCSKCHNPHASRLPKLMITNCLDTKHNTWDDNRPSGGLSGSDAGGSNSVTGGDNDGVVISQAGSAQNCHRLGSGEATGGTGDGWNNVTPWSVKPPGSL